MNTPPETENAGMPQPGNNFRKKRPSMLDAFAQELLQMDRDKKSLSEMLDWLKKRDVTASPNNLSHYLKNLREAHALKILEQKFDSRAKKWAAVREWLGKHPRPDLETVIEVLKMLVMDLATEEAMDPGLLALADKLSQTAIRFVNARSREAYRARKLVMEEDDHAEAKKTTQAKALGLCLDESKKFPEVAAAFKSAFDALDKAEGITA